MEKSNILICGHKLERCKDIAIYMERLITHVKSCNKAQELLKKSIIEKRSN